PTLFARLRMSNEGHCTSDTRAMLTLTNLYRPDQPAPAQRINILLASTSVAIHRATLRIGPGYLSQTMHIVRKHGMPDIGSFSGGSWDDYGPIVIDLRL